MEGNKNLKDLRQITVTGSLWDSLGIIRMCDQFFDSRFVSFYQPWLRGEIAPSHIINFREKRTNILLTPFKIITRTIKISRIIKEFDPKIIITHHDDANTSIIPILLFHKILRKKRRFVVFMRAGIEDYSSKKAYWRIIRFLIRIFYRYFDVILTPSKGNALKIRKFFGLQKTDYVYNSFDTKDCLLQAERPVEKKLQELMKGFVFITIGRLTKQKGQWYLLRAFRRVVEKESRAKLIIVGEGELKNDLEKLKEELGLEKNVFFIGKHKNVHTLLRKSDCFVLTSLWETFGNVIIEALIQNKLIITTDCESGPREIIAPELSLRKHIHYPFFSRYGILIKPFKQERIFENIEKKPLIKEEVMLSDMMLKVIKQKNTHTNGLQRARDFDINHDKVIATFREKIVGDIHKWK